MASGFCYPNNPLKWGDQFFERDITPSGAVSCETALRAGGTNNGLDILLVASDENTAPVVFSEGSTITLTISGAASMDGDFAAEGGAICITTGSGGVSVEPGQLAARFAIGDCSPYIKAKVTFSGTIGGGNLDCCLGYMPR